MLGTRRYELVITWTAPGIGRVKPIHSRVAINAPDSKSAVAYAMHNSTLAGFEIPLDANIRSVSL